MDRLIETTLGEIIENLAEQYPEDVAITYATRDYTVTWSEFNQSVDRIAKGFLKLGAKKGDHIAVWATNIPEWFLSLFAAVKIGCVVVTVNTNYKSFEVEYLLKQSDSKFLIMNEGVGDNSYIETMNKLIPNLADFTDKKIKSDDLPELERIIIADTKNIPEGMVAFDDLEEMGRDVDDRDFSKIKKSLNCHEVINMQYTSGTTGFPKGVMLTHYNIINNGKSIGDCMKFTRKDRLLITVPLFHCFGLVLGVMACITHATSMVPVEKFSPSKVMHSIQEKKCTAVHGVPTMFITMLEHPDFSKYDFTSLRTGIMAGSPCPAKIMKDVNVKMHIPEITIVFGQTESSPGCTQTMFNDTLEHRCETVGKLLPFVEAKIVDPVTNLEVPKNTPGEFVARGYNIMKGYYKMPEATARVIDKDGWLHFGDLCTEDEDGYFRVVGRIKDMIIRGGENIYPKELEEFYYHHEDVKDVQVIGVPSEQYGEEVMALIILREGSKITENELKKYAKDNLAKHKVPKYIRFVDSYPVTASGKVQKFKMCEDAIEMLKLEKNSPAEKE